MSVAESMREDFRQVFVETYGETFEVIRNGKLSHEVDGIVENNQFIRVYHDADVEVQDVLKCKMADNEFTVYCIEPEMVEDECITKVVVYQNAAASAPK